MKNDFGLEYNHVAKEFKLISTTEEDSNIQSFYTEDNNEDANKEFSNERFEKTKDESYFGSNKSKTPVLDNFGRDLTKLASKDKLDPL